MTSGAVLDVQLARILADALVRELRAENENLNAENGASPHALAGDASSNDAVETRHDEHSNTKCTRGAS